MSHWYRLPGFVSAQTLLFHKKQSFILDYGVSAALTRYLPKKIHPLPTGTNGEKLSCSEVVDLCKQLRSILITANSKYAELLHLDTSIPWGIVLLPSDEVVQLKAICQLASGGLVFRPSTGIVGHAQRNRLLLDLRHDTPIFGVYSNCRWLSETKQSSR
jgi:hypothetical protein